ncbi:MAG: tRNA lysidine(34) synthetase TilS [Chloroflexi bacterium RBG_16_54_18]|nr:MAG: tRNA lysidine(34) synthetase TilS [Chloroflexi bacterium RBG_16_54_18]
MLNEINTVLLEKCRITPGELVLAGVSGGPDSLCLMHVLHSLEYAVVVAHLDHQLRPESAEEATRVEKMAAGLGLRFVGESKDVESFSRQRKLSLEEGARLARYQFLFQEAKKNHAKAVMVGHTADDQVETVLMHLLRGAGLAGLSGMPYRSLPNAWSAKIPLLRPLLGVWRETVWEYLNQQGLKPSLDPSNLDARIYRNRLRHELIPYLETFNPRLRQSFWRTADILRQEDEILQERLLVEWESVLLKMDQSMIIFDFQGLKALPLAMQRRVFHKAVLCLRPAARDLNYQAIERAIEFLNQSTPGARIDLIFGLRLNRETERLVLAGVKSSITNNRWPQAPAVGTLWLQIPGELNLAEGWALKAEVLERSPAAVSEMKLNKDHFQAWLDYDQLENSLGIRARLPGDRFKPLGMPAGSIKVSDFMINVKLPEAARRSWPLVLSGSAIAWLPGFRLAHDYRISSETTRMAHLRLELS